MSPATESQPGMLVALVAFIFLVGCQTNEKITLRYSPSDLVLADSTPVGALRVGPIHDLRPKSGTYLGTMRVGVGQPFRTLIGERPLADTMASFLAGALSQRMSLNAASDKEISVDILMFEANQLLRREVEIELVVRVSDRRTGAIKVMSPVRIRRMEGSVADVDSALFGQVPRFQRFIQRVLSEAVDEAVSRAATR